MQILRAEMNSKSESLLFILMLLFDASYLWVFSFLLIFRAYSALMSLPACIDDASASESLFFFFFFFWTFLHFSL